MSKVIKIAAIVVGVAALVYTGLILFAPEVAGSIAAAVGVSVSTLSTALAITASVLSIAAGLMAPKPTFGSIGGAGTQLDFIADPTAGQPYVMGNTRVGEAVVHEASWGDKNRFLGIVGVLSCAGPIMAYSGLYADDTAISFSGGDAVGYYDGYLYHQTKLGNRPESAALTMTDPGGTTMPNWGSAYKLSGLAASGLVLVADVDNGKVYSGGVPQFTHQIKGVLAYDPRLDSTNGGTGAQRPGGLTQAETAYAYSENPWVHHGTYALGRWDNGIRVIGPGVPSANIDWPSHIEAANIADANGWKISGRILSTDNKWDALRSIAQAGGGYPVPTQAKLACLVNTPRVSLETIEEAHVKGPVSVPQMAMRRDRLNGATARYREPSQAWQVVSSNAVRNSDYLAADGGTTKTKEIDLPLVADKDQAAQLIAYEVANSRERTGIQIELDLYWSQYRMGDCVTLNLPSALLFNQKAVIIGRELDPESNTVRFTFRTEDDAKHAWALGVDGGTPPTAPVGSAAGTGDSGAVVLPSDVTTAGLTSVVIDPVNDVIVHADSTGTVLTGELPLPVPVTASVGTSDITTLGTWSRTTTPGVTCTIGATTGVLSITVMGVAEATIPVAFTYSGIARTANIHVVVQSAPQTSTGGSGGGAVASTTTLSNTTGTAYDTTGAVSATLTCAAGSGGQVALAAPVSFKSVDGASTVTTYGKWQWRVVGGTFADVATEVTAGTTNHFITMDDGSLKESSGSLTVNQTKTGLTAGTSYEFRFLWRDDGHRARRISGTLTATGS